MPLTPDDDASALPPPGVLLNVTHCPKPEHAGDGGKLSWLCRRCDDLLCPECAGAHSNAGHLVQSVDFVADELKTAIRTLLPELRAAAAHYMAQTTCVQSLFPNVESNTHESEEAFDMKVAHLRRELTVVQAAVGELVTIVRIAEMSMTAMSSIGTPPQKKNLCAWVFFLEKNKNHYFS